jgi:hypothetical protein
MPENSNLNGDLVVTGSNGDKRTVEVLLKHSTESLEQVAISQTKMAEAITKNSEALVENSQNISKLIVALDSHVKRHDSEVEAIKSLPENIQTVIRTEMQSVPATSWKWIWDGLTKIGAAGGGFGILIGLGYLLFKLFTGAL